MTGEPLLIIIPPVKTWKAALAAPPFDQLWLLALAMRPRQWAKNLLIYLAFFFTLGEHDTQGVADEMALFGRVAIGFLLFSLLSGATYVVNDLADLQEDRVHPRKRLRPLASGRLSPAFALSSAIPMAMTGVGLAFLLDLHFGIAAAVYLGLTLAYSLYLKKIVIVDVLTLSGGFVLRAAAGALVIDVPISPWLYVMTSLGALFIALGKRRNELALLGDEGELHRQALKDYSIPLVDQLVAVVTPVMVVAYTLYTFTAENLPDNNAMMLTIPFVLYGVFRYLFLVHRRSLGGSPEEIFLTDYPLLITIVLWLITASAILLAYR